LKGKYRWRDVNEELPENSGEYFVMIEYFLGETARPSATWFEVMTNKFHRCAGKVTHWMPIPELKEQGE